MGRSSTDLKTLVARKFGEQAEGTAEGPHRAGPYRITRVWTQDASGEYHAHYVVEEGKKLEIYQNFSPFAAWLTDAFDLDKSAARETNQIKVGMAALVVMVSLGLFGYLVVTGREDSVVVYLMTAIVGGGSGFLFGNWSRGGPPAPPT